MKNPKDASAKPNPNYSFAVMPNCQSLHTASKQLIKPKYTRELRIVSTLEIEFSAATISISFQVLCSTFVAVWCRMVISISYVRAKLIWRIKFSWYVSLFLRAMFSRYSIYYIPLHICRLLILKSRNMCASRKRRINLHQRKHMHTNKIVYVSSLLHTLSY